MIGEVSIPLDINFDVTSVSLAAGISTMVIVFNVVTVGDNL